MLIEVNRTEEEGKKEYKVTPKVSVQENKAVTVDVSEYTEPVEILPPEGKVAMEKVTLTLDNIPSSGSATAYCWKISSIRFPEGPIYNYISADVAPTDQNEAITAKRLAGDLYQGSGHLESLVFDEVYTRISDNEFTLSWDEDGDTVTETYVRYPTQDITFWE